MSPDRARGMYFVDGLAFDLCRVFVGIDDEHVDDALDVDDELDDEGLPLAVG